MKTKTKLSAHVSRFVGCALAFLAMLWATAPAHAQTAISITTLLQQGLTNSPTPYSLRVTDIQGVGIIGARLDDIYFDGIAGKIQAHSGFLSLYSLNYDLKSASVSTNSGGKLTLSGTMTLMKSLEDAIKRRGVTVPKVEPVLIVDSSGSIAFEGGTFTLQTPPYVFPFGPLTFENVSFTIDTVKHKFGGGMDVGIGGGPTVAFCVPQGSTRIRGSFYLKEGEFDELTIGASNLKKSLGTSGSYLDTVTATIANLGVSNGAAWSLKGSMSVFGGGCPPPGTTKWPWKMDATASVNSAGNFEIKGTGYSFNVPVGSAYFRFNPPATFSAGGSANFVTNTALEGIFIASIDVQCSSDKITTAPTVSGKATGKLTIPKKTPLVGGWVFGSAEASFNNSGFRGSVTANLTPAIPSKCTGAWCLVPKCRNVWRPTWTNPFRTVRICDGGLCFGNTCTPAIPAVSATIGFKYENDTFSFTTFGTTPDPMVEPWEKSFKEPIIDEKGGHRFSFMDNWERLDKYSTGTKGKPILTSGGDGKGPEQWAPPQPPPPPPLCFDVPAGEESIMFRLTWENTNNTHADMNITWFGSPAWSFASDEVSTNADVLQPLYFSPGSYYIISGLRREAIIGIPRPDAGPYCVTIDQPATLGNYAVELLRQNVAPVVSGVYAAPTEIPTQIEVRHTTHFRFGNTPTNPPTRIFLSQAASDPNARFGTTHQTKAGGTYLVESLSSVEGASTHYLFTDTYTNVPDGEYNVVVNIDDPYSLEVEAFSTNKITIHNATAPAPVPSFATRADNGGFTVTWQPSPSPSTNIQNYIVAYTKAGMAHEFEGQQSFGPDERTASIGGLDNGQPYLVTVFAMDTNSIRSGPAETQRVIPTAGYGLNPPIIVSKPLVTATAGYPYVYLPEIFDADDVIRPSIPLQGGADLDTNIPSGLQWTLVTAPTGMTIDPAGIIEWTPTEAQVGDHPVTVRVTDLSSLPPVQETNGLIAPRFGEQTYTLVVVGSNNPPAFERNHYRFLTTPPANAYAGEAYRYVPIVMFPTNKFTLTVDDGPVGLAVVVEGTAPNTTNVVVWNVPANALGHRVLLRATPDLGGVPNPDDTVLQEFYLDVSAPAKRLPQTTVITSEKSTPQGFGLSWVGSATGYQVQRATNLPTLGPINWQNITATNPAAAVNFLVDTNSPPGRAFYRILNVP